MLGYGTGKLPNIHKAFKEAEEVFRREAIDGVDKERRESILRELIGPGG